MHCRLFSANCDANSALECLRTLKIRPWIE